MNKFQKAIYYFREYGWEYTKNRALKKLGVPVPEESEYMTWLRKRMPKKKELNEQREKKFPLMPTIDVVIDITAGLSVGSDATRYALSGDAAALTDSIKKQTYPATGTVSYAKRENDQSLAEIVGKSTGDLILFAQADTVLSQDFLYEIVNAYNERPEAALFYTDEDCGTADGKHRMKPYFKPDIAPELLTNFQYIGGVFVVRRTLLSRALSDTAIEPFGNYWQELLFVLLERLMKEEPEISVPDDIGSVHPRSVLHIAKPLFTKLVPENFDGFWRVFSDDQVRLVERHLSRMGRSGTVERSEVLGFTHVRYALPDPTPLVSILIPNKDHFEDLDKCVQSLLKRNTYPNFELIIAENNSTAPETFAYYDRLTGATYTADRSVEGTVLDAAGKPHRIAVVTWKDGFNYSGINNFAATFAKGELFLLLNNDTEIKAPQSLAELVSSALLEGFGGAGAMLYYGDGTIQHGGVVYKIGGFAANALWSLTDRDEHYYPYSVTAREMSCCTAACLILRREAFEKAGGFDEKLAVALNDVDLCLKVRRAGYKILFNPYATLFHYESKSRGSEEESREKLDRFNREIAYFQSKWQDEIDRGDPYYNVNQTLHYANYSLELAEDNRGRYQA